MPPLDTYVRIGANKLGQPHRMTLATVGAATAGFEADTRIAATLEGDTLTLTPDPSGPYVVRAWTTGKTSSSLVVPVGRMLGPLNNAAPLSRAPLDATAEPGRYTVHLRSPIPEAVYRERRWRHYRREDAPMDPSETLHLADGERTAYQSLTVSLPPELHAALQKEARDLGITLPSYIVRLVEHRSRAVTVTVEDLAERAAQSSYKVRGQGVRQARRTGKATGEELIARGLPPASDEAWLRARLAEGMSYSEMARAYGGGPSVYSKWGRRFGIEISPEDRLKATWRKRGAT